MGVVSSKREVKAIQQHDSNIVNQRKSTSDSFLKQSQRQDGLKEITIKVYNSEHEIQTTAATGGPTDIKTDPNVLSKPITGEKQFEMYNIQMAETKNEQSKRLLKRGRVNNTKGQTSKTVDCNVDRKTINETDNREIGSISNFQQNIPVKHRLMQEENIIISDDQREKISTRKDQESTDMELKRHSPCSPGQCNTEHAYLTQDKVRPSEIMYKHCIQRNSFENKLDLRHTVPKLPGIETSTKSPPQENHLKTGKLSMEGWDILSEFGHHCIVSHLAQQDQKEQEIMGELRHIGSIIYPDINNIISTGPSPLRLSQPLHFDAEKGMLDGKIWVRHSGEDSIDKGSSKKESSPLPDQLFENVNTHEHIGDAHRLCSKRQI